MPWNPPANWTPGEVVTASKMNAQVRDNLSYLKGVLDGVEGQDIILKPTGTASGPSDWIYPSYKLTLRFSVWDSGSSQEAKQQVSLYSLLDSSDTTRAILVLRPERATGDPLYKLQEEARTIGSGAGGEWDSGQEVYELSVRNASTGNFRSVLKVYGSKMIYIGPAGYTAAIRLDPPSTTPTYPAIRVDSNWNAWLNPLSGLAGLRVDASGNIYFHGAVYSSLNFQADQQVRWLGGRFTSIFSPSTNQLFLASGAGTGEWVTLYTPIGSDPSRLGVSVLPSNVIQAPQNSITDPIADSWTTYSTSKIKEVLGPADDALKVFYSSRPVKWRRKEAPEGHKDSPKFTSIRYGLVADDPSCPSCIQAIHHEEGLQGLDLSAWIGLVHAALWDLIQVLEKKGILTPKDLE